MNNLNNNSFSVVFKSAKFEIQKAERDFYIKVYAKGADYREVNDIVKKNNIQLSNFKNIMTAFTRDFNKLVLFGKQCDRISVELANEDMKATTIFFVQNEELFDKEKIVYELNELLAEKGIVHGIDLSVILDNEYLSPNFNYEIAKGNYPVPGEDSKVKFYNFNEIKPMELLDGKVDHYNIGLINVVEIGEWLGEWTKPTEGVEGTTVKGKKLLAKKGKIKKIPYDRKTIEEIDKGDKICLYAKKKGAISFDNHGFLKVSDHLILKNIDLSTGNVDFDGDVTVFGTIEDGFSLIATGDIQILGAIGVGAVNEIKSHKGKIAMAGGINGKGKSTISAINADIKYISNAKVSIKETLKVNEYILNSAVRSRNIQMSKNSSSISASVLSGVYSMEVGILGSESENKTSLELMGPDPELINSQIDSLRKKIESNKISISKLDQLVLDKRINTLKKNEAMILKSEILYINEVLEKDCLELTNQLQKPFEGTILAKKTIYPGVKILSKHDNKIINRKMAGTRISIKDGEIIVLKI